MIHLISSYWRGGYRESLIICQSDASGTDGFGYVLKDIYERCDTLNTQLLAWWVPRELNNLADHLSHLAALLNEDTVEGVQVDRLKA